MIGHQRTNGKPWFSKGFATSTLHLLTLVFLCFCVCFIVIKARKLTLAAVAYWKVNLFFSIALVVISQPTHFRIVSVLHNDNFYVV